MPSSAMNARIKNYLGIAIILALLVFAGSLVSLVYIYYRAVEPTSFRSFAVSGEGKVTAVPDLAEFTFSVITEGGKDLAALQAQNTDAMNKAIAYVKQNGVADGDVKTQSYNVEPRYQYSICPRAGGPCPPPEIVGYAARQDVLVKMRDFTKAGALLGGVVQNGANSVSQLSFTLDDPFKVQNEARAEAIKRAKEKAMAIAEAGGFRLGGLISIEEAGSNPPVPYPLRLEAAVGAPKAAPTVEPGSEEVTVNINLRYEIK